MEQSKIGAMLKAVVIGFTFIVVVVYTLLIPILGRDIIYNYPEFSGWFWPWIIFLSLTAIPLLIAIFYAWKVVVNIGKDNSFCIENAVAFKNIMSMAILDTTYFFIGQIILLLLGMNHPTIFFISVVIVFIGIAVSIVCGALSTLLKKAASLQEDQDLTI